MAREDLPVTELFRRKDCESSRQRSFRCARAVVGSRADSNRDSMILTVGDAAIREGVQDKSEVMQFLRHARNAVAHGNQIHFREGEPKYPAVLRRPAARGGSSTGKSE